MGKKMGSMTAEELQKELESDPVWVKNKEERDKIHAERVARLHSEQRPIVLEIAKAGIHYETLGQMLNSPGPYKNAIPILLLHLQNSDYSDPTRETLARCLAVSDAQSEWDILVDLYRREPFAVKGSGGNVKHGLAVAVAATTTDHNIDVLAQLAADTSLGDSRILLLKRLKRSKSIVARQALSKLEHDPELAKAIASWKQNRK